MVVLIIKPEVCIVTARIEDTPEPLEVIKVINYHRYTTYTDML